jgi:capsular exopolysaccharide synthesis family protein
MEETSAISLKNLFHAMRAQWPVLLAVSLLLFGGIGAFVLSLKPAYTSDALVLLAPAADELAPDPTDRNFTVTDPMFVRSETNIIQSDEICREVIEQLHLDQLPEFQRKPGIREMVGLGATSGPNPFLSERESKLDGVLRMYQNKLTVFNDGRNKTVDIGFTASDPRLAAQIANAHAQAYLRHQAARGTGNEEQALAWLKSEVDARGKEARDADALVQQYQMKNGIVGTKDSTIIEQRLAQLNTQLVDAQRNLSTQSSLLHVIRDVRGGADPSKAASLLQNDSFNDLLRSRVQAEATLNSLETRLAPTHPTLIKARQDLISINNTLDKELRRMENEAQSTVASAAKQVDDLTAATHAEALSKVDQDRLAAGLPGLISQAQVKRTVFETVLSRYQTRLAERGFRVPSATVVSHAAPSAVPSFPKTPLLLAIGAMLAFFGGTCAALVVHVMRPPSQDLDTIADRLGIQPLVAIPRYRNASRESGVVKMKDPRLFIESIRSVRSALFEQQDRRHTKTCLLTSIRPGQGKSLVAMSLARALARGGAKTLFLEMDLRCPSASALARRSAPLRGMGAVLEGRAQFGEVVVRDETTGLDMLFAERAASSAVDQLTALKFAALVAKLRTHYDAIIIDSPPIGLVADALTIAPLVDQTVMIAKAGEASTVELARGTRLLKDRGASVAGLVLTGVDPKEMTSVHTSHMRRYVVGFPARNDADFASDVEVIRPAAAGEH